jgi:hypothetical protein
METTRLTFWFHPNIRARFHSLHSFVSVAVLAKSLLLLCVDFVVMEIMVKRLHNNG